MESGISVIMSSMAGDSSSLVNSIIISSNLKPVKHPIT